MGFLVLYIVRISEVIGNSFLNKSWGGGGGYKL